MFKGQVQNKLSINTENTKNYDEAASIKKRMLKIHKEYKTAFNLKVHFGKLMVSAGRFYTHHHHIIFFSNWIFIGKNYCHQSIKYGRVYILHLSFCYFAGSRSGRLKIRIRIRSHNKKCGSETQRGRAAKCPPTEHCSVQNQGIYQGYKCTRSVPA